MNGSLSGYLGMGIFAVVLVASLVASKVFLAKKPLPPQLPPFGPLPLAALTKYYAAREPAIVWERVRGWNVNERPPSLGGPSPVDHVVLGGQLLEFCSGASGKMHLVFNFLVGAIQHVEFNPGALPPGTAPPGIGLVTIHTPSGQTLLVASGGFAQALQQAVASAQGSSGS
jgi:hypothetical protein